MGASHIISTFGDDFTHVDPSSDILQDVSHILIDPSCSGSGLVASQSANVSAKTERDTAVDHVSGGNIAYLALGQKSIILHAMNIPSATTISYSTCSVFEEENEAIVHDVLLERPDWVCVPIIPSWPNRGILGDGEKYCYFANNVIRATYDKDTTNGFFVARFEKRDKPDGKKKHKKKKREDETKEERKERKRKKRERRGEPDQERKLLKREKI